jgi:hypothetical protein
LGQFDELRYRRFVSLRIDNEMKPYRSKSDEHILCHCQSTAKIKVALSGNPGLPDGHAKGCRDRTKGDPRASHQGLQKHVA